MTKITIVYQNCKISEEDKEKLDETVKEILYWFDANDDAKIKKFEGKVKDILNWFDSNDDAEIEEFEEKVKELDTVVNIMWIMYFKSRKRGEYFWLHDR